MSIAINKSVTNVVATAGVWTLTLSDVDGILLGMKGDVDGFMTNSWNVANVTVTAVNTTAKTVTYSHGNSTVASQAADANFHLTIDWIDSAYVEELLGFDVPASDAAFLEECVQSAQDWAYRKRAEAGYNPHPGYAGGADVRQGTGLYAVNLYRERGTSGDSMPGYEAYGQFDRPVNLGRILQLLGVGRPAVG